MLRRRGLLSRIHTSVDALEGVRSNVLQGGDLELEHGVIEFYRAEIRRRYQLENLRRFDSLDGFADEHLDELRDFFLDRLYPPVAARDKLDAAFDQLGTLLRSPKRLTPLMRMAITSMWRLGRQLPAAISAGLTTVDALRETRKLEAVMMAKARELKVGPADMGDRLQMLQVLAALPEKHVRGLVRDVLHLFECLSNVDMLSAMLEIMQRSMTVMEDRRNIYGEEEREGLRLGLDVLEGGHALFMDLEKHEFPLVIKGIELVELDWYNGIRSEAGA